MYDDYFCAFVFAYPSGSSAVGMYVLVLLLQELINLMAIILVKGETIQKEQDLTI